MDRRTEQGIKAVDVLFATDVEHFQIIDYFGKHTFQIPEIHLSEDFDIPNSRSFQVTVAGRHIGSQLLVIKHPIPV